MVSGCGSVGRAVASITRDPWFESRHRRIFIEPLFAVNCVEKTKIRKKNLEWPIFKKLCTIPNHNFSQFFLIRINVLVQTQHLRPLSISFKSCERVIVPQAKSLHFALYLSRCSRTFKT